MAEPGEWILVACPYGCSQAVEAYQDEQDPAVLWCPNCKRTIATVQPLARVAELEAALWSVADTLNDESLLISDAAGTAYRLCVEALSVAGGADDA